MNNFFLITATFFSWGRISVLVVLPFFLFIETEALFGGPPTWVRR